MRAEVRATGKLEATNANVIGRGTVWGNAHKQQKRTPERQKTKRCTSTKWKKAAIRDAETWQEKSNRANLETPANNRACPTKASDKAGGSGRHP